MVSACARSPARMSRHGRHWSRTGPSMKRRELILGGAALGTLTFAPRGQAAASAPVLRIGGGRVRGMYADDLQGFRGIRYGADTGPRRFMPPSPAAPWRGIADARGFGAASPQPGSEPGQSEDCLFLNVTAPRTRPANPRPVIGYIHGGAYSSGSGSRPCNNRKK